MVLYGADVAALDALAVQVLHGAEALERVSSSVRVMLFSAPWNGSDAEGFRAEWNGPLSSRVSVAVASLRDVSEILRRNAAEQLQASSIDGTTLVPSSLLQTLGRELATNPLVPLFALNPLGALAYLALTNPQAWPNADWTRTLHDISDAGGGIGKLGEDLYRDLHGKHDGMADIGIIGLGTVGGLIAGDGEGSRGAIGNAVVLGGEGWGFGKDVSELLTNPATDRLGGGFAIVGGALALMHDQQTWSSDPHPDVYKGANAVADSLTVVSGVAMMIPGGQGVAVAAEGASLCIHGGEYLYDHRAGIEQVVQTAWHIEDSAVGTAEHAISHALSWL